VKNTFLIQKSAFLQKRLQRYELDFKMQIFANFFCAYFLFPDSIEKGDCKGKKLFFCRYYSAKKNAALL
jgi:hypothetical protein